METRIVVEIDIFADIEQGKAVVVIRWDGDPHRLKLRVRRISSILPSNQMSAHESKPWM